jgi:hypothetical protein
MGGWDMVYRRRLDELAVWNNGTAVLTIARVGSAAITAAAAAAGTTYQVRLRLADANGDPLSWGNFTLAASIGDTVAHGGTVPTLDDATPTLAGGETLVTVTLPAGTYVADETVTVTLADFTAPDGRTLTGGTSVLTIAA